MKKLYDLKEKLVEELESYADKGISSGTIEAIDKLAHAAKNIGKVIEMCDEDGGYSERNGIMYRGDSYRRGGRYDDASYRRRDSMGRYSRTGDDDTAGKIHEMKEDIKQIMTKLEQM